MEPLIQSINTTHHLIEGSEPVKEITKEDGKTEPNPDYLFWTWNDGLLTTWLPRNIETEVLISQENMTSAHKTWKSIEEQILSTTIEKEMTLNDTLMSLKKDNLSLDEYLKKFKSLCDSLATIKKPVDEIRKVFQLARGGIRAGFMETRAKSNTEFCSEIHEILARHKTKFEEFIANNETRFEQILNELQALRLQQSQNQPQPHPYPPHQHGQTVTGQIQPNSEREINPFETEGTDPMGWIFKAEQYFEFKGIAHQQQMQLASFHLENVVLKWYRWYTKFRGALS
ncbi:hypothetical protein Ddye_026130 [Dipteronia dyeriana]|uniref:Retrotransposon gag domain-containing protein n=1 Tax=Dipteronia dyeriana TaxID=168575 RepID=A0AAD9TMN7_9ROSI|nr:hypothetical protein Ddye_026130 [Dipteronia dyeriana]